MTMNGVVGKVVDGIDKGFGRITKCLFLHMHVMIIDHAINFKLRIVYFAWLIFIFDFHF